MPGGDDLDTEALAFLKTLGDTTTTTISGCCAQGSSGAMVGAVQKAIEATNKDQMVCPMNASKVQKFTIMPMDFAVQVSVKKKKASVFRFLQAFYIFVAWHRISVVVFYRRTTSPRLSSSSASSWQRRTQPPSPTCTRARTRSCRTATRSQFSTGASVRKRCASALGKSTRARQNEG